MKARSTDGLKPFDLPPEQRREVMRTHINLNHPAKAEFVRALKHAGAKPSVLRWTKDHFTCPQCAAHPRPNSARPALLRALQVNVDTTTTRFLCPLQATRWTLPSGPAFKVCATKACTPFVHPCMNPPPSPGLRVDPLPANEVVCLSFLPSSLERLCASSSFPSPPSFFLARSRPSQSVLASALPAPGPPCPGSFHPPLHCGPNNIV